MRKRNAASVRSVFEHEVVIVETAFDLILKRGRYLHLPRKGHRNSGSCVAHLRFELGLASLGGLMLGRMLALPVRQRPPAR
jgi:hypothetical protein